MFKKILFNSKGQGKPILYPKDAMLSLDNNLIPGIRILKSQPDTKQINQPRAI